MATSWRPVVLRRSSGPGLDPLPASGRGSALASLRSANALDRAVPLVVLVLVTVLTLLPLGFIVFASFRTAGPGAPDAGFTTANWGYALGSSGRKFLGNSVLLGLVTAAVSVPLGSAFAWIVTRTTIPLRKLCDTLLIVPLLFSPLLTTIAWIALAGPRAGAINQILHGIPGLGSVTLNIYSFYGLVLILSLFFTPYVYIVVRATFLNMDRDLEDAARLLGGGWRRSIRKVTLPMMRPAILGSMLLVFILAADEFTVASLIGANAGFFTVPYEIYNQTAAFPGNPPGAAALALVQLVVAIVAMYLYGRTTKSQSRYVTLGGKGARGNEIRLGRLSRIACISLLASYIFLSVVLPYVTLLFGSFSRYFTFNHWSTDLLTLANYDALFGSRQVVAAFKNTLILIVGAGLITTLLATVIAWTGTKPGRLGRAAGYVASIPLMVPGMALGVGIFWAYVFIPTGLYGSLALLGIAYVTRFVGHGVRVVSVGFAQIAPQLEEAAWTLGSSRVRTLRTISLPLVRASMASALVLVGIFASLELSASVMLYTSSTTPASVFVWLSQQDGEASQAFAAGAFFATVTLVLVVIGQRAFRSLDRL